jgi:pyruvate/2-oxoglutarate/acetoin dehydrogenase E1 component|tara:strand:- start:908 stop:1846 length:939 start_codon:yes stop_codon:yes gene_type:complete
MKYIEYINKLIQEEVLKQKNLIVYGQNIAAGSCLGGLTKNLQVKENGKIINSTNSENSLCGFGFGMMIGGIPSIFFMKQLDFLLLGIDHLTNTYNIIRNSEYATKSSFTIMPITVDKGYEGPQSSLNNFGDFCSISRTTGYTITNKMDAEKIIQNKLVSPGFRIITVSQRLFKEELIEPDNLLYTNNDLTVFQYDDGEMVTIVCFNFSFPQGYGLSKDLKKNKIHSSLFNVNSPVETNWSKIIESVLKTKKLIVIDDSKSKNLACDSLITKITNQCKLNKIIILKREISAEWLNPNSDEMIIDYKKIISQLS